jgi:hypothetical protein
MSGDHEAVYQVRVSYRIGKGGGYLRTALHFIEERTLPFYTVYFCADTYRMKRQLIV